MFVDTAKKLSNLICFYNVGPIRAFSPENTYDCRFRFVLSKNLLLKTNPYLSYRSIMGDNLKGTGLRLQK